MCMYKYMYKYIYMCMYTCMSVWRYVRMHACTCRHLYMNHLSGCKCTGASRQGGERSIVATMR